MREREMECSAKEGEIDLFVRKRRCERHWR